MTSTSRLLPGLLLVLILTLLALFAAQFTIAFGVGAVALGVLFGLVVGNVRAPGPVVRPGVAFAGKRLLAVAVVLLGLRVVFEEFAGFGLPLLAAVGVVAGAFLFALLIGRLFGMEARFSALIGAGTGVCGVAAIAAMRPVVGSRDAETTYAVATVALLGSIGLVVFPLVQLLWHPLDPGAYGVLAGAGLHSVPQAVGAGFAGGGEAGGTLATVVKLTRVALLGPLVLLVVLFWHGVGQAAKEKRVPRLPVEVWGFLLVMVLGNLLPVPDALRELAMSASGLLLVAALTALGLSTRFLDLHAAGPRPMVVAVLVWGAVVVALFVVLRISGFTG